MTQIAPHRRRVLVRTCGAVLFLLALTAIGGCALLPHPPNAAKIFAGRPPPEIHRYPLAGGQTITAAEIGRAGGPLVVFIHGSPGHWQDYANLLADQALGARALLVAVNRLGWGESGADPLEPSLAAQAAAIRAVIAAHPGQRPVVIVGHSLGGPVAARVAIDFPEAVDALVLVSASVDPALEAPNTLQKLARLRLIRWAVPKIFLRADEEIKPLKHELEAMVPLWTKLHVPVTVIHGDADQLVPVSNADFAARMIVQAPVEMIRLPRQGHLIPWQRPDAIRDAVLRRLDQLRSIP